MAWVDSLLNLVCVLLAVGARAGRDDWDRRRAAATLAGTLRPAAVSRVRTGWTWAAAGAVWALRTWLDWLAGGWSDWSPRVDFGVLTLSFPVLPGWRGLGLMAVYTLLSLAVWLTALALWMVLLSCAGQGVCEGNPVHAWVRRCVGPLARWPCGLRLVFPMVCVAVLWLALEPLLFMLGLLPQPTPWPWRAWQALVMGVGCGRAWVPVVTGLLVLYWLNLYVYFGRHPIWDYVARIGRRWVSPVRWLPLRVARMDFAPVALALLVGWVGSVADHGWDLPGGQRRVPSLAEVYAGLRR
ncbi:hypothetical protein [Limisphaera sp. 4302-co]|uniref:hypothetical protein n=1 Tax=Limisphaera sp. 4302-co TaxID=3400417 RepID=UPI003C297134